MYVFIQPICVKTADMARLLGFSERWLQANREKLVANGAKIHDGRWHVASTEAAWLECCHKGQLGNAKGPWRAGKAKRAARLKG